MIGAIIGDIVGSVYEFNNHRSKIFPLFDPRCSLTDDSIMTLAIARALTICGQQGTYENLQPETIRQMQRVGRCYPDCGWGGRFGRWIFSDNPKPYDSFGNGAAMRVSAIVAAAPNLETAKLWAKLVTEISHNHREGIKGALATVELAWIAKEARKRTNPKSKDRIFKAALKYYPEKDFAGDFNLDAIRPKYRFNETCQETVPQAIEAFLESRDFEDAIRNAISIGGDSDTLAAITGTIAEAFYGVKQEHKAKALKYFDSLQYGIYSEFSAMYNDLPEFGTLPGEIAFQTSEDGSIGGISTMGDVIG